MGRAGVTNRVNENVTSKSNPIDIQTGVINSMQITFESFSWREIEGGNLGKCVLSYEIDQKRRFHEPN